MNCDWQATCSCSAIFTCHHSDRRVRYGVTRLEVLLEQLTKQQGQPNVCVWVTNPHVVPVPCRVLKPWHYYKTLVTEVMVVSGTKLITNRRTMKLPVEISGLYSYADLCPKLIRYELVDDVFVFTEPENL